MKINTTRWKPDTCGCVFEYDWDADLPESERVHTLSNIVKGCGSHADHSGSAKMEAVLEENQRKNQSFGIIMDSDEAFVSTDTEGNRTPNLKKLHWSWDSNRNLLITADGITTNSKNTIQAALNTQFGSGKIVLS